MLPGRAVVASGAGGLRSAPDALTVAWPVAVLARGGMVAPRPIAHRTAPLTARGIVAMLVLAGRRVMASRAITRRTAVPALRLVLLRRQQSADERKAKHNSSNYLQLHFVTSPSCMQRRARGCHAQLQRQKDYQSVSSLISPRSRCSSTLHSRGPYLLSEANCEAAAMAVRSNKDGSRRLWPSRREVLKNHD